MHALVAMDAMETLLVLAGIVWSVTMNVIAVQIVVMVVVMVVLV